MFTYCMIPSVTLRLGDLWESLSEAWKKVLAHNLDLVGYFEKNDIDYLFTLKELDCSDSAITDLWPLYYMPQLERLDISRTNIEDFGPIESLINLREFDAVSSNFGHTSLLRGLNRLEMVDISYSTAEFVDLSGLYYLDSLKELYCNACAITSFAGLCHLPEIQVFSTYFNKIHDEYLYSFRETHPNCRILR